MGTEQIQEIVADLVLVRAVDDPASIVDLGSGQIRVGTAWTDHPGNVNGWGPQPWVNYFMDGMVTKRPLPTDRFKGQTVQIDAWDTDMVGPRHWLIPALNMKNGLLGVRGEERVYSWARVAAVGDYRAAALPG